MLDNQRIYQHENIFVLYNKRQVEPLSCFLIIPKNHSEKVYGLTLKEVHDIAIVRKALVEVLKETYPQRDVFVYTQDDPSVGQTVFHSHEQVVSVDAKTVALSWMLMHLDSRQNVSAEELEKVKREFGPRLDEKIKKHKVLEAKTA